MRLAFHCRGGFTIIQLLVVIVILAMLIAFLLPTLCRSSEQANRIKCASNLRQIGQSIQIYQQHNKGALPRTISEDEDQPVPVFFTNAAAPNPFSASDAPNPNDVTAALYLLVRAGDLMPEVFICPASQNERDTQDPLKASNFLSELNLSYSYQNPYSSVEMSNITTTPSGSARNDFAWAADINPGGAAVLTTPADARRTDMMRINSPNHAGEGQNVLFEDCHVDWSATPFAGMARASGNNSSRDNIYLAGGVGTATVAALLAAPADAMDNILLPVSSSGPALAAVSVRRVGGVREIVWIWAAAAVGVSAISALLIFRIRRRRRAGKIGPPGHTSAPSA